MEERKPFQASGSGDRNLPRYQIRNSAERAPRRIWRRKRRRQTPKTTRARDAALFSANFSSSVSLVALSRACSLCSGPVRSGIPISSVFRELSAPPRSAICDLSLPLSHSALIAPIVLPSL